MAGKIKGDKEYPKFQKLVGQLNLSDDVVELGFIGDDEIGDYFRCSDAFVFPSLYEGFGFPVLEAMSSGTAVVAGDNSSLPELTSGHKNGETGAFLLEDGNLVSWVAQN